MNQNLCDLLDATLRKPRIKDHAYRWIYYKLYSNVPALRIETLMV